MYYREFDAEIRKNGVEGTKTLYDRGNFFINYYLSRTQFWIAVVIVDRGYVKGCVVVSNSDRKRLINTINTTPIKSFSDIIRKHTEAVLNKGRLGVVRLQKLRKRNHKGHQGHKEINKDFGSFHKLFPPVN